MSLQSLVGGLAAPGAGHADTLAYQSAYLLSSGVEVLAVAVVALLLVGHVARAMWLGVAARLSSAGSHAAVLTAHTACRERA